MALFEKRPSDSPLPEPARPGGTAPRPPEPRPKGDEKATVIGSHVVLQGDLDADEDLVIEGRLEGHVTDSKSLRVGPAAHVRAELKVRSAVIAGTVIGNVTATERVEILASGSVQGDIRSPRVVIADGARLQGSVDMRPVG